MKPSEIRMLEMLARASEPFKKFRTLLDVVGETHTPDDESHRRELRTLAGQHCVEISKLAIGGDSAGLYNVYRLTGQGKEALVEALGESAASAFRAERFEEAEDLYRRALQYEKPSGLSEYNYEGAERLERLQESYREVLKKLGRESDEDGEPRWWIHLSVPRSLGVKLDSHCTTMDVSPDQVAGQALEIFFSQQEWREKRPLESPALYIVRRPKPESPPANDPEVQ